MFVQYLALKLDPIWRRLPDTERARGRSEFAEQTMSANNIRTFTYSTLGMKADCELFVWRTT